MPACSPASDGACLSSAATRCRRMEESAKPPAQPLPAQEPARIDHQNLSVAKLEGEPCISAIWLLLREGLHVNSDSARMATGSVL